MLAIEDLITFPKMTLTRDIILAELDDADGEPVNTKKLLEGSEVITIVRGEAIVGGHLYVIYSPELREATTVHEMFLREVPE